MTFAIDATASGFNLNTVGIILMVVVAWVAGLGAGLSSSPWSRRRTVAEEGRERRIERVVGDLEDAAGSRPIRSPEPLEADAPSLSPSGEVLDADDRSVEQVRGWLGRVMVDRDGNRLGRSPTSTWDRETDRSEWAVWSDRSAHRSSFVPLAEASVVDDQVQVPHARILVKDAPNIEADGHLSEAEEAGAYRHYGLDYDTVTADSEPVTQSVWWPSRPGPADRASGHRLAAAPTGGPSGAATTRSCKRLTPWGRPSRPPTRVGGGGGGEPAVCV